MYEVRIPELIVRRCATANPGACNRGIHFGKRADADTFIAKEQHKREQARITVRADLVTTLLAAEGLLADPGAFDLGRERQVGMQLTNGEARVRQVYDADEPMTADLVTRYNTARAVLLQLIQARYERLYGTAHLNRAQRDLLWDRAQRGWDSEKRYAKVAKAYLEIATAV